MKRVLLLLIFLSVTISSTFAQQNDSLENKSFGEATIDLGLLVTPVLSSDFYEINYDLKASVTDHLSTGVYLSLSQKRIKDTFHYSISKPKIEYYEVGCITQYNFLQSSNVQMNVNLTNGIAIARLGDDAIKQKEATKYGYTYVAKKIAVNHWYLLQPGADLSFKLFSFHHSPDVWITAMTKYRFLFGREKYGTTKQFSGYSFGVAISLIGYTSD